jgi:hypothetical protein
MVNCVEQVATVVEVVTLLPADTLSWAGTGAWKARVKDTGQERK